MTRKMQAMQKILLLILPVALCAAMADVPAGAVTQEEVPRITKEELRANLNNEDVVIIDVRTMKDWNASDYLIKGARRENPMDINFWYNYPKDKTMVLYCA
jgi:hypothetical protein